MIEAGLPQALWETLSLQLLSVLFDETEGLQFELEGRQISNQTHLFR